MAYLEAVLHMKCMGSVGAHFPSIRLFSSDGTDSHYMFGRTRVHATHVMATHYHLQTNFCTFCGAYGAKRSKYLQRPCPSLPTKAGLEAIRLISIGRRPDHHKAKHEEKHGRQIHKRNNMQRVRTKFAKVQRTKAQLYRAAPSFALNGPAAPPVPIDLQPEDLAFLRSQRARRHIPGPHDFSPLGLAFSGPNISREGTPLQARVFPNRNRIGSPAPSGPTNSDFCHAVCSTHGRNHSWRITDFCKECEAIAAALVGADL